MVIFSGVLKLLPCNFWSVCRLKAKALRYVTLEAAKEGSKSQREVREEEEKASKQRLYFYGGLLGARSEASQGTNEPLSDNASSTPLRPRDQEDDCTLLTSLFLHRLQLHPKPRTHTEKNSEPGIEQSQP